MERTKYLKLYSLNKYNVKAYTYFVHEMDGLGFGFCQCQCNLAEEVFIFTHCPWLQTYTNACSKACACMRVPTHTHTHMYTHTHSQISFKFVWCLFSEWSHKGMDVFSRYYSCLQGTSTSSTGSMLLMVIYYRIKYLLIVCWLLMLLIFIILVYTILYCLSHFLNCPCLESVCPALHCRIPLLVCIHLF